MSSESKRASVNVNKVPIALPKAESSQPATTNLVSQDMSLQMAVGSRIRVTTAAPSQATLEGTVYTADTTTGLLVLSLSSNATNAITPTALTAPSGAYKLIPMSQISSFQILSIPQASGTPNTVPTSTTNTLDTNALSKRLDRAVANAQVAQSRKGPKGISAIDQDLFDALAKTHPARWHGTSMIISDVFMISKPYEKNDVKLLPEASGNIDRMRTIVDIERKKAVLKQPLEIPIAGASDVKNKGG